MDHPLPALKAGVDFELAHRFSIAILEVHLQAERIFYATSEASAIVADLKHRVPFQTPFRIRIKN